MLGVAELADVADQLHEDLLRRVLRGLAVAQEAKAPAIDRRTVRSVQLGRPLTLSRQPDLLLGKTPVPRAMDTGIASSARSVHDAFRHSRAPARRAGAPTGAGQMPCPRACGARGSRTLPSGRRPTARRRAIRTWHVACYLARHQPGCLEKRPDAEDDPEAGHRLREGEEGHLRRPEVHGLRGNLAALLHPALRARPRTSSRRASGSTAPRSAAGRRSTPPTCSSCPMPRRRSSIRSWRSRRSRVICNVVDPITKEPYSRDPRNIALKAENYLKSTGIGDTAFFGPEPEFFIFDEVRYDYGREPRLLQDRLGRGAVEHGP